MILSDALILSVSQLHTQHAMTSLIRSHTIFNTDFSYSCAHFVVEIDEKSSLNGGILMLFNGDSWYWFAFLGHPVCVREIRRVEFDTAATVTCIVYFAKTHNI